ncbi:Chemotaxis protein CheW [Sporomusa ovata DSM 2662]|uniref:Positive regulator of CheA protein activity (CheW) n=1 Tax=Sporomusa ovata TaxID=2378 RepID=A0A0U1KZJ0_9FIRM|nr:chemotaxis protein CheW [Sporomusa ovata]EQB27897.1 chemotaxis protein chew [Sporomusa ovata DSM 2662]CQR72832.1 Positive regulator of CheA protein activity (CheW) [Sporomusa ovata]
MEKDDTIVDQELQLVIFKLAQEEYGLPITKVKEINRLVSITKLPQMPPFMEGIINLRSRIIPVIDLRKRFGIAVSEYTEESRIIIVEVSGETVGVIVDAVAEVVRIAAASVEPPPPSFVLDAKYIQGIGKLEDRLLILLEIDQILSSQETINLKQLTLQG